MNPRPLLILMLALPLLQASAIPLVEISIENVGATQVAVSEDLLAYITENGSLVTVFGNNISKIEVGDGKLLSGRGIFLQKGRTLYSVKFGSLKRIMECDKCYFYPYSESKLIVEDSKGLLLVDNGSRRRIALKGLVRWSDDGRRFTVISRDRVTLLKGDEVLWSKDLNTQILDAEPDDLTYVCLKGCEVYAINDGSFLSWMNRLCKCCIPGKLDRAGNYLYTLMQGNDLSVLNPSSGRVMQRIEVPGYEVDAVDGVVVVRDGKGGLHILVDFDKANIRGESGGIWISWDLPKWIKGRGMVSISYPGGRVSAPISDTFIPIPKEGEVNLTLNGFSRGIIVKTILKPLEVEMSPFGDISVTGDGSLEVKVNGRIYGQRSRVDTGWLPFYSARIYNHGVLIDERTSFNAKFLVILMITLLPLLAWLYHSRRSVA